MRSALIGIHIICFLTVIIADFSQIEPTLQCTNGIVLTVAAESLQYCTRTQKGLSFHIRKALHEL